MNYTVVINCAVWFGALAYYFIDAHKWFTGPKVTIAADDLTEEQSAAIQADGIKVADQSSLSGRGSGSRSGSGDIAAKA